MAQEINVGIDFGTTNCTVGLLREDGGVSVQGPMPSLGVWSNGEVTFGHDAVQKILSGDPSVYPIRDLKLVLGTDRRVHAGPQQLDPIDLATQLFRDIANRYFPNRIPKTAVIGTPIRFSRDQRKSLRVAAEKIGFERVRLVYEPTAALIGRGGLEKLSGLNHVLIVDWGGGTLDIAVVRVQDDLLREVAVAGDIAHLGGTCLDAELARLLLAQHAGLNEASLASGVFERFKTEVEFEKIEIFEDLEGEQGEIRPWRPRAIDETFRVDPVQVCDVARKFARRAVQQIHQMLLRSGIQGELISHLLFCGGVCKAGVIREEIGSAFPNSLEIATETPQLLTGRGCGYLLSSDFNLELAADFAARQADDSLCILLRRGQSADINRYRTADFLVTDILASEAMFEFGVCQLEDHQQSLMTADSSSFVSLGNMCVRVAQTTYRDGREERVPDIVRVHVAIDENLTVAVHLQSHGGRQGGGATQEFFTGVPLAVRLNNIRERGS